MSVPFTVIVPCYDERDAIGPTLDAIQRVVPEGSEILVVDDGSKDGTAAVLEARADARVRVVRHERNRGYGAALKTGLARARHEVIVIVDADGTYPLERIPELAAGCTEADMVVGARVGDDVEYPMHRALPKSVLRWHAEYFVGARIPDLNSGMRAFRRSAAMRFVKLLPDGFSFTTTITMAMLRNHLDVRFVPIGYRTRVGRSKMRPIRDTINFVQLILRMGMTFAPLRLLAPLIVLLGAAFAASATYDVVVLRNLTDKTVMLFLFALNAAMFALLADMIDRRSP